MSVYFRILCRAGIATALVAAFFIVTQDIQIFPGLLPGLFTAGTSSSFDVPEGIKPAFVATDDDESIEVWELPVENSVARAILFHGNAETVRNTYGLQRWLSKQRIASFAFDYRGYGRSSGWPDEDGLYADAEAVYRYATSKDRGSTGDTPPLILMALSVGTGPAAWLAAKVRPDILILVAPFRSLPALVSEIPLLGYLQRFLWYVFPVEEYVATLDKSTCIIIVHGEQDRTIPVQHSRRLHERLAGHGNLEYIEVPTAGHNDLLSKSVAMLATRIEKCLYPERDSREHEKKANGAA